MLEICAALRDTKTGLCLTRYIFGIVLFAELFFSPFLEVQCSNAAIPRSTIKFIKDSSRFKKLEAYPDSA